jgi:cyanophycinase-like exopeptidase
MDPVDRYLMDRLQSPADVVCLPTAAGTEGSERIAYWSNLGTDHFTHLGVHSVSALPVIDRHSAQDESLAAKIRAANFVYLSGGKPDYLFNTLVGTAAWAAILSVLEHSGVVAGCSAGAMIFGARIPTGFFTGSQKGFGLLTDAFVMPHFDEMPGWIGRLAPSLVKDLILVGIEGMTALVCTNEGQCVEGSGGVTIDHNKNRTRYTQE